MYKVVARLMIVTMMWNTLAFAQTSTETGDEAVRTGDADTPAYVDPYYMDYRTGRRVTMGLDEPIDADSYVVGPYDRFLLTVRGPREFSSQIRVLPEGTIQLPNVGILAVSGMTITEMRDTVRKRLSSYYRNVDIELQLVIPRTLLVYVLGEVVEPGPVELYAPFRLDKALREAGSITGHGSQRAIEIRRDGDVIRTADYLTFLRLGDRDHNPALQEGMIVYVPTVGASCTVMGEVWRGGNYEILPGETVADMVELAGGVTPQALPGRIVLERLDENDRLTVTEVGRDELASTPVQGRDVLVVPDRKSFPGADFIRVNGGGGRDGIVYIEQGETIASFLPRFMRLQRTHDLSRAVVEREEPSGEIDYIPVDLEAVIAGTDDGSLPLLPGDVINIPPYETAVYVVGEVPSPGPIPFQRGLPAERYVALAGGPGNSGSIDRLEIISPDGSKRGGDRTSTVYRGETIVVKTKKSRIFQAVFVSVTSLTSLVLSIIAVSRD